MKKNGGQKSRDTLPLNNICFVYVKVEYITSERNYVGQLER